MVGVSGGSAQGGMRPFYGVAVGKTPLTPSGGGGTILPDGLGAGLPLTGVEGYAIAQ